jgi:hypothetical protein
MVIRKVGNSYRLFSRKKPSRALGPKRASKKAVIEKDEKRVEMFKHMKGNE